MNQRKTTIMTTLMVAAQAVLPTAGLCVCVSESAPIVATNSCCDAPVPSSCSDCGKSECACDDDCGQKKSACDCGCNSEQQPGAPQEPERPTESQLKILIRCLAGHPTCIQPEADKTLVRSRSELACERVQSVQVLWDLLLPSA